MIKATNDGVLSQPITMRGRQQHGHQATKRAMGPAHLQTHATYTAEKDHTASVTDANGGTTTLHMTAWAVTSTSTPIDTESPPLPSSNLCLRNDRQYRLHLAGGVLYYGYTNGVQTEASRYSKDSQARPWQRYHLTLDAWGTPPGSRFRAPQAGTLTWAYRPHPGQLRVCWNNGYLSK